MQVEIKYVKTQFVIKWPNLEDVGTNVCVIVLCFSWTLLIFTCLSVCIIEIKNHLDKSSWGNLAQNSQTNSLSRQVLKSCPYADVKPERSWITLNT